MSEKTLERIAYWIVPVAIVLAALGVAALLVWALFFGDAP